MQQERLSTASFCHDARRRPGRQAPLPCMMPDTVSCIAFSVSRMRRRQRKVDRACLGGVGSIHDHDRSSPVIIAAVNCRHITGSVGIGMQLRDRVGAAFLQHGDRVVRQPVRFLHQHCLHRRVLDMCPVACRGIERRLFIRIQAPPQAVPHAVE